MSSVKRALGQTPLQGVQMVETEEIRFELGDACCSIAGQGYDVRAELARPPQSAMDSLQGRISTDLGRAERCCTLDILRWACYSPARLRSRARQTPAILGTPSNPMAPCHDAAGAANRRRPGHL